MRRHALLVLISLLAGVTTSLAAVEYYWFVRADREVRKARELLQLEWSHIRYGTVQKIDRRDETIVVRMDPKYAPDAPPRDLSLTVTKDSIIAEQHLVAHGQIFDSLSPLTFRSMSDIPLGARVMVRYRNDPSLERTVADVVLFGNPL